MSTELLHVFLIAGAVLALLLLVSLIFRVIRLRAASEATEKYTPGENWELRAPVSTTATFNESDHSSQSEEWCKGMSRSGQKISELGVKTIYFVHGTFVGSDPFDIFRLISHSFPKLESAMKISPMSRLVNKDSLFRDVGHFTKEYCEMAEKHLGHGLQCKRFCWSSGNHHLARVMAAFELLEELTESNRQCSSKILLVGHSHAGQLFAIITRMIQDKLFVKELESRLSKAGFSGTPSKTADQLKALNKRHIYFVTLGTPPRYQWYPSSRHKVLHIINHRLEQPVAGRMGGLLTTRDGDYIQQIGIAGSDGVSPVKNHHSINRELNAFLDEGSNLSHWQNAVRKRQRIHPGGFNYLTDYGDQKKTPNFLASIFGHGIYTRYRVMLYNMEEIADFFTNPPEQQA